MTGAIGSGLLLNLQSILKILPPDIAILLQDFTLPNDPMITLAGNILIGIGIILALLTLFGSDHPQKKLARSLQKRGDDLGAAEVLLEAGFLKQALPLFKKARAWNQAATVAEELGQIAEAAALFRRDGGDSLDKAARLYKKIDQFEIGQKCHHELANWHIERDRYDSAIEAWIRAGEINRAVHTAMIAIKKQRLNPVQPAFKAAMRAAQETRNHTCVAQLREIESDWSAAAQAWRLAGRHESAAINFQKAGNLREAANEEQSAGHHQEAMRLRINELDQLQGKLRIARARGEAGEHNARRLERQISESLDEIIPRLEQLDMDNEINDVLVMTDRFDQAIDRLIQAGEISAAADIARDTQHFGRAAALFEDIGMFADASDAHEMNGDLEQAAVCAEKAGLDQRALDLYRGLGNEVQVASCMARIGLLQDALTKLHSMGEIEEACKLLRDHPGPIPDIPEIVLDMAQWLTENSGLESAISCLQRAVQGVALQPKRLPPAVTLARSFLQAGEFDKALKQVDRILGFDYSHQESHDLRKQILAAQEAAGRKSREQREVTTGVQRYEILDELGRGGMGVVYRARDTRLERDIAIKVLRTTSESEAARLEQEAKVAATLNHPGIVTVFDFEAGFDGYFIAMEYVPGRSFDQILKENSEVLLRDLPRILTQLAEAVAFAHSRQVVHRDLKPGNILLTPDGDVKILDFGIATRIDVSSSSKAPVVGTPFYMAPEQIRGEIPTPATDVYSFGTTSFHLATGRPPFKKGNVIEAHLSSAPPHPLELNPDLAPGLSEIILKCLEKEPEDRYKSAAELREALLQIQ